VPSLSHVTSCTPTKSNLYLANSLAALVIEHALYRLLTFQVPNFMSLFVAYVVPKYQSRSEAFSVNNPLQDAFLRWGVFSTSPYTQAEGTPLVGCPPLLIQYIRSYHPYWRPFFQPQPEDAPLRGDRAYYSCCCNIGTNNLLFSVNCYYKAVIP
jgi:hypothetical protein